MRPIDLVLWAIEEAFMRTATLDSELSPERRDKHLSKHLLKIQDHFEASGLCRKAIMEPLASFGGASPLALSSLWFAGAFGPDAAGAPESCKALLGMGADPMAASPLPTKDFIHGQRMFGRQELSPFELAISKNDGHLLLEMIGLIDNGKLLPQHWCSYKIFFELQSPIKERCDQAMKNLAERQLLDGIIIQDGLSDGGRGKKRL